MPVMILSPEDANPDGWQGKALDAKAREIEARYSKACGLRWKL